MLFLGTFGDHPFDEVLQSFRKFALHYAFIDQPQDAFGHLGIC